MSQARVAYTTPRLWHVVDARDQVLGRLAAQVAALLVGKHKPTCTPHVDGGDHVVVLNAAAVALTGKKPTAKLYRWHTGWMGGLKTLTARQVMERDPARVVEHAVKGMLPMNNSRDPRMTRLRVYADEAGAARHARQIADSRAYAGAYLARHAPRDVRPLFVLEARQKGALMGDAARVLAPARLAELEKQAAEMQHDPQLATEYAAWQAARDAKVAAYENLLEAHIVARAEELNAEDEQRLDVAAVAPTTSSEDKLR